jgi:hypothetical protein
MQQPTFQSSQKPLFAQPFVTTQEAPLVFPKPFKALQEAPLVLPNLFAATQEASRFTTQKLEVPLLINPSSVVGTPRVFSSFKSESKTITNSKNRGDESENSGYEFGNSDEIILFPGSFSLLA